MPPVSGCHQEGDTTREGIPPGDIIQGRGYHQGKDATREGYHQGEDTTREGIPAGRGYQQGGDTIRKGILQVEGSIPPGRGL